TRTPIRLLVLTLASALAAVVLPATAQAAPYCGITWGSTAKAHSAPDREMVNDIRAGRHACFDRMVVDLGGQGDRVGSCRVRRPVRALGVRGRLGRPRAGARRRRPADRPAGAVLRPARERHLPPAQP